VVVALVSFVAGMPLRRLARAGWSRVATSSRRRWVARQRTPLMLVAAGIGGIALLVRDAPGVAYVVIVLALVAVTVGVIALVGSQVGDPVADELGADDEGQHGHDHGVVGGHP
jgi:hypothetical protein